MKSSQKASKKKTPSTKIITQVTEAESDRRLGPVIDALYTQNSKQAHKLVQQALQKRPGWPAARALRACYYLQAEKLEEAENEIDSIRDDFENQRAIIDEDTARKIHMYYQELRKEDIAGEFYEQAWKNDPKNIKLAEIAFALYIRGKNFSAAQKIATKVNRIALKKNKYGMWAAVALWLSLKINNKPVGVMNQAPDSRMLKLVTAMIAKAIDGSFVPTAEMVRFATRVYREAGQLQEAYQLVSHPRLVMDDAEILHIRADLGLPDTSETDYRKLLTDCSADDWQDWISYLDYVSKKENWQHEAYELIQELNTSCLQKGQKLGRGLCLAKLEIHKRAEDLKALADDIGKYFELFGAKKVCAYDLRTYLSTLHGTDYFNTAMEYMEKVCEQKGFPSHLTLAWIKLWFNLQTDDVNSLWESYFSRISNYVEKTDGQPGDEYLLLAAHKLLPIPEENESSRYVNTFDVMQTIIILEAGLTLSPFNFQFKLLLIRLYTEIGALGRVGELFESLDIKHIQAATLSYLVLIPLFESGHHDALQSVLERISHLWQECDKEIPECISKALQHGSVNAATEFVLFREQLQHSTILAQAQIVEAQMELVRGAGGSLGHRRAFHCLTKSARFAAESFIDNSQLLLDTNNTQCYQFWTLKQNEVSFKQDSFGDDSSNPQPIPTLQQDALAMNLLSLKTILECGSQSAEEAKTFDSSLQELLSKTENITSDCLKLRVRITLNLQRIKLLLIRASGPQDNQSKESPTLTPAEDLAATKLICQQLQEDLHNIVGQCKGENKTKCSSPVALRRCGSYVFDILLQTGICISSLTPDLMKGRKRIKKSSAKIAEDQNPSVTTCFQSARDAILTYRNAVIEASSDIEKWVTDLINNEEASLNALFGADRNPEEMCHFLPDKLEPINLIDGLQRAGGAVSRSDFCAEILADVHSSYMVTCSSILETLANTTRTLKLADF